MNGLVESNSEDDVEEQEYENEEEWLDVPDTMETLQLHPSSECLLCTESVPDVSTWLNHLAQQHSCAFRDVIQSLPLQSFYDFVKLVNYTRKHNLTSFAGLVDNRDWMSDENLIPLKPDDGLLTFDFGEICQLCSVPLPSVDRPIYCGDSHEQGQSQQPLALPYDSVTMLEQAATNDVESDDYYFESYASIDIHAEMLGDAVRTKSYQKFILQNVNGVFKGRTVLDIGCGTGILSMFAAEAGAQKVYAVDNSQIIYEAMEIALDNGFDKEIQFLHGRLEELKMPFDKVDVIVSEWMGYFLFYERMLDSVLFARDVWLKDPMHVYPRLYTLHLQACSDEEARQKYLDCWLSQYGYRMSSLWRRRLTEPQIGYCAADSVASAPQCVCRLDLATARREDQEFASDFSLTVNKESCKITHLVAYFDVDFSPGAADDVTFSTGPQSESTHWKQTIFWLKESVAMSAGECLRGRMSVTNIASSRRSLQVEFAFSEPLVHKQIYTLH